MIDNVITSGDSLDWTEYESSYSAADGWLINYSLVNNSGRINFSSTQDGVNHSFIVSSITTGQWKEGLYSYQRYATKGSERKTLTSGSLEIKSDFSQASDQRSHYQKTLDAIEAVIENRATLDQESYSINGRSLARMNIKDLIFFRGYYFSKVKKEKGRNNKIMVRI